MEAQEILALVQALQSIVVKQVRGSRQSAEENNAAYVELRKQLMQVPSIQPRLPRHIRENRELVELWPYLRDTFKGYATREAFVRQEFRQILDELELGVREINTVFDTPLSDTSPSLPIQRKSDSHIRLRDLMEEWLSVDEVADICFRLSIDFENIRGETKSAKIRELVIFCDRDDRIPALLAACRLIRPTRDWTL